LLQIRYSIYRTAILSLLSLKIVKQVKESADMPDTDAELKLKKLLEDTTNILVNIDNIPYIGGPESFALNNVVDENTV
jgi:hypothetical protein